MRRTRKAKNGTRGIALVMALVLVVIAVLIGTALLSSSRTRVFTVGRRQGATGLAYQAQEGIYKAFRRIQEIVDPSLDDSQYKGGSGYPSAQLTVASLVNPTLFPPESSANPANPTCPQPFDPTIELNVVSNNGNSNVICNFMGTTLEDTQVTLVRKDDYIEGNMSYAVILINSISRDSNARLQIVQGVVIIPYLGTAANYYVPVNYSPYLANVVTFTE